MKIGIFADSHDHVDNVRHAINVFNREGCELVLCAGDFVSPIVVPPLRKLHCRMLACFGDSDGNKTGIEGGLRIIGDVGEPPFGLCTPDGTRILLTHQLEKLRGLLDGCDVAVYAHTHKPSIERDRHGRLLISPGETGGWVYRKPTIAILETPSREARIVPLPEMPPPPAIE